MFENVFSEKMVLFRFREFHGLYDDKSFLKSSLKKVNHWPLSYTEKVQHKKRNQSINFDF